MATLQRSTRSIARTIPRTCVASTSRLPQLRSYATEVTENTFGTTQEKQIEGAYLKRYTGPGFPHLNSRRHTVHVYHPHLWNGKPLKELTIALRKSGGRDITGKITQRYIGGGHKQRLRCVDFWRMEPGVHDVIRIEYDPGRSAHIALIRARDGANLDLDVETGAELADTEPKERKAKVAGLIGDDDSGGLPVEVRKESSTGDESETSTAGKARKGKVGADDSKPTSYKGISLGGDKFVYGGWSYILAPDGLRAGDVVQSYRSGVPDGTVEGWVNALPSKEDSLSEMGEPSIVSSRALGLLRSYTLKPGNVLPLYLIPPGTTIHNLSLRPNSKMALCRAAGSAAQVVAHHTPTGQALGGTDVLSMGGGCGPDGKLTKGFGNVLIKLRSGEVRRVPPGSVATIGSVSNKEYQQEVYGKAGRMRWLGYRPVVRGTAMNANEHPHGGGRGKSKGGRGSTSIWGWTSKGRRTRRSKDKDGNKAVVTERPRGPRSRKG